MYVFAVVVSGAPVQGVCFSCDGFSGDASPLAHDNFVKIFGLVVKSVRANIISGAVVNFKGTSIAHTPPSRPASGYCCC